MPQQTRHEAQKLLLLLILFHLIFPSSSFASSCSSFSSSSTSLSFSPPPLVPFIGSVPGCLEDLLRYSLTNVTHGGALHRLCIACAPTPVCPCDEECPFSNGCCYDYAEFCETAEDDNFEEHPSVETLDENLKSEQFSCYGVKGERHGYLLVDTCSKDYNDTYASGKCRSEENGSFHSISHVTVSSLASGVSYRNIYCAVCNNETVKDLRAWPVQMMCNTEEAYEASLVKLRNSNRDVAGRALKDLNCSVDVRLPVATEGVDWRTPVRRVSARRSVTRCHTGYSIVTQLSKTQSSIPPISILLDFGSSSHVRIVREETVVAEEQVACPAGHVFDPFASRCRRLFCEDGYVLTDGRCVFVPIQGSVGELDVKIHVTRTIYENNTGPDCSQRQDETSFCLASFFGIDLNDVTLHTTKHPETGMKTGVCSYIFLLDSSEKSFQTLWTHLLSSWSPTENFGKCRNSGVWFTEIERKANDTDTPCKTSLLNATDYSIQRNNSTGIVNTYSSEQVAIHATFNTEGMNFSRVVELEICYEVTFTCPLIYLNRSLFREADGASGSVVYIPTGRVFTELEYQDTGDGRLELCSFLESNGTRNGTITTRFFGYSDTQAMLSLVGNVVSMVAGGATFLTYFVFDVLRNHATCCIMNLVASLFMAQLLLLLTGSAIANPAGCTMVAALSHYFWLVNVFWTGILAYDLNRTFAGKSCIVGRGCDRGHYRPRLRSYALLTWGGGLLIVVPCLVIYLCDCTELPIWYGNSEVCWIGNGQSILVVFAAPLACILLTNIFLFMRTVWSIRKTNKETQHNVQKNVTKVRRAREELIIYVKISTLMGFTWIFGFAAAMSDLGGLWYVFIILNTLQGLLIFLSFTCKQRVRILWMEAFCGESSRKRSYSLGVASSSASATRITRV
ncbi:uncharacterized protein LOC119731537 [Patiria miniata]|uniref:G-protein coupled receptors family 2 profile 2 domain-containing protein n=1 Tax=Patiria miniata TaxID=46514 RepID=A0A914ABA3_PATMI|nr:uncharacterized protein LOC119731537 [Patiria miniata]